jgi:hypothetical protein
MISAAADPLLTYFCALFGIAILSGITGHFAVKSYIVGVITGTFIAIVVGYIAYIVAYGRSPSWMLVSSWLPVFALVVAAVGIPFNRKRTGHGLNESWEKRRRRSVDA